jgi:hypothetical protein
VYIGGLSTKLSEIHDKLASASHRQHPGLSLLPTLSPFTISGREVNQQPIRPGRIYALSSGMMTEHTLSNIFARKVLPDPSQHLFFVGYADPNSPAGQLRAAKQGDLVELSSHGAPPVPFHCHREIFTFSAHARREDLLSYAIKVRPKTILLVHGDDPAIEWFKRELYAALPECKVIAPPPGQPIDL